jgi:hypothetical protein
LASDAVTSMPLVRLNMEPSVQRSPISSMDTQKTAGSLLEVRGLGATAVPSDRTQTAAGVLLQHS